MTDKSAEDLCCLVDGELSSSESKFLLRRLQHDRELVHRWERYHLAKSVLRGQIGPVSATRMGDFSKGIAESIRNVAPDIQPNSLMTTWIKPAVGMALAVAVGAGAFFFWVDGQSTVPAPDFVVDAGDINGGIINQPTIPASAQLNPHLRTLVIRHNAVTASGRGQGLVPYVSVVSERIENEESEAENDEQAAQQTR